METNEGLKMLKVYAARGMSHRVKEEVVNEAAADRAIMSGYGVLVLDPVAAEGVESTKEVLRSSKKAMDTYWSRDKEMIREANVVFDLTPHLNSEGVKHEIGYARYALWKPVIRVFPKGQLPFQSSVSRYEDDAIFEDLHEAVKYALETFGTWQKRFKWRFNLLVRCLPRWVMFQVQEWK